MAGNSKISAVFGTDTRELERGIKRAQRTLNELKGTTTGLSASMQRLGRAVSLNTFVQLGTLAASAVGKFSSVAFSATKQASDLGEELSKSAQIFGENAGEIEKFANSASALGFTKAAALEAAGSFGNMFTAMKLSSAQSADMSLTFTKLAADMASFNNTSVDDAVGALGAALRGESEPIRRFGVLLDDATLRAKAFELGMTKTAKDAMTPAIKAQAAYAAILDQTAKAQGDFARTSGGLANMSRVLEAQVGNMKTSLGRVFTPILENVAQAISKLFEQVGPVVEGWVNSISTSWDTVGPKVMSTFFDVAEVLALSTDYVAGVFRLSYQSLASVFNYFGSLMPEWATSINWLGIASETLQRAVSFMEAVGSGVAGLFRATFAAASATASVVFAGFREASAAAASVASVMFAGLREAAQLVGFSGETFDNLAKSSSEFAALSGDTFDRLAKSAIEIADSQLDMSIENYEVAGSKFANAFSTEFKPTELGKIAADSFNTNSQDLVARWREGFESAQTNAAAAAGAAAGGQVGGALTASVQEAGKAVSLFFGTGGASNYVAGLINKTGSSVEKRQLAAAERTAEGIEKIVDKVGLEAVSIA